MIRNLSLKPVVAASLLALASASAMAVDLPDFTFNPAAAGLNGESVRADNFIISDYSRVTIDASGHFTDTGYMAVNGYQLDSAAVASSSLNKNYGMYLAFTGAGTTTTGNPTSTATWGSFSSLNYTLYGYNGPAATFSPDSTSANGGIVLATGSLTSGSVGTIPMGGSFIPSAGASLTFNLSAAGAAAFSDPVPFYNLATAAFTNPISTVTPTSTGFTIQQGGGSINFVSAVPEPETYALMLAGLGVVGMVARRRRPV